MALKTVFGIGVLVISSLYAKSPVSLFEIRGVSANPSADSEPMTYTSADGQTLKLAVQKRALLDLSAVESVSVVNNSQTGQPELQLTLTPAGRLHFAELTKKRNHQRIAILIDGKVREAPVVAEGVTVTSIQVHEGLTPSQVTDLAARMNAALGK